MLTSRTTVRSAYSYAWFDVKTFQTEGGTEVRERLDALFVEPGFADLYMTAPGSEGTENAGGHGPWKLSALAPSIYRRTEAEQVKAVLLEAANGDPDLTMAAIAAIAEKDGPGAQWLVLRAPEDHEKHDSAWVLDDFVECIVLAPDGLSSVLVVGSD